MNTDAGSRTVLLDPDGFQMIDGLVHRVCEAVKHPDNPVLPLGDLHEWDSSRAVPWEGTVIYDHEEALFKSWYCGTDLSAELWYALGYAISEDGIHWEKPNLGLFEYKGSKDNNICLLSAGRVVKDPAEPDPAKRYKILTTRRPPVLTPRPGFSREHLVGYSPDGIHWTVGKPINIPGWTGAWGDLVALIIDDDDPNPERRFKLVWQNLEPNQKPGPPLIRTKYLVCGPDIEHYTSAVSGTPVLSPDGGSETENHFVMLAPYAGGHIMPYEYGWYVPDGYGNYGTYHADVRLAISQDGENFRRIQPHQKLISRGRRGEWDDGFLVISDKLIVKDDTLYFFYCGQGHEWSSWPGSHNLPECSYLNNSGSVRLSRMGLATLPLDRITCFETADGETPGSVVSQPLEITDRNVRLVLNISAVQQNRSWIEVEVLEEKRDQPLPGMGREDCTDMHTDSIRGPVAWRDRKIADLKPGRIRLRFWLYGAACLHAFGFETVSP